MRFEKTKTNYFIFIIDNENKTTNPVCGNLLIFESSKLSKALVKLNNSCKKTRDHLKIK